MKDHVDHYLVNALGVTVGKRTDFRSALKLAQKIAQEQKVNVAIDAVEQVTVTQVTPNGGIQGRTEE